MTWRANEDLELLELIAGRSCILPCTSSMYTADRNMYGRGSTNSMIVTRPRHAPSPFDPPTRTAQACLEKQNAQEIVQTREMARAGP